MSDVCPKRVTSSTAFLLPAGVVAVMLKTSASMSLTIILMHPAGFLSQKDGFYREVRVPDFQANGVWCTQRVSFLQSQKYSLRRRNIRHPVMVDNLKQTLGKGFRVPCCADNLHISNDEAATVADAGVVDARGKQPDTRCGEFAFLRDLSAVAAGCYLRNRIPGDLWRAKGIK